MQSAPSFTLSFKWTAIRFWQNDSLAQVRWSYGIRRSSSKGSKFSSVQLSDENLFQSTSLTHAHKKLTTHTESTFFYHEWSNFRNCWGSNITLTFSRFHMRSCLSIFENIPYFPAEQILQFQCLLLELYDCTDITGFFTRHWSSQGYLFPQKNQFEPLQFFSLSLSLHPSFSFIFHVIGEAACYIRRKK